MPESEFGTLLLLGYFAAAFVAASAANRKNRSGLAWFVLSLLLGPIAWLAIAIVGPLPAEGQKSQPTGWPPHEPAPRPRGDAADQLLKLAELRDAGAITPTEFEAKKAELLARM